MLALAVWLVCAASALLAWRRWRALRGACLRPDDAGVLLCRGEERWPGTVTAESVAMGALIMLHWQPARGGRGRRFCLCRDGFAAEDWRVLSAWLRWSVLVPAGKSV